MADTTGVRASPPLSPVRAYLLLARMWLRVASTYRASFAVTAVAQFLVTGLDFVAILIMFAHVDTLGGFTLPEIAFLYGAAGLSLGFADLALGSLERLGTRIRTGQLDAMLVRPVPLYAQVCAEEFAPRRLGRILQNGAVFVWACTAAPIDWTPARAAMVPYLLVCGAGIFVAIFTITASVQFWTQDASEFGNAFTYGGGTLLQYPLTIYPREAVRLLTFVVPVAFVNWYPSLYVLGRPDPFGLPDWFQFAAPVALGVLGLVGALVWRTGVRRYRSTGS